MAPYKSCNLMNNHLVFVSVSHIGANTVYKGLYMLEYPLSPQGQHWAPHILTWYQSRRFAPPWPSTSLFKLIEPPALRGVLVYPTSVPTRSISGYICWNIPSLHKSSFGETILDSIYINSFLQIHHLPLHIASLQLLADF
ncbi:hypothetical protein LXL04_013749 [Taraxacum kok-saghyz]